MKNMKKKKIIHCLYNLKQGGSEQMVIDLCNWQSKSDKVVLLTFWDNNQLNESSLMSRLDQGVELVDLNVSQSNKTLTIFKLFVYLKKSAPSVVHIHMGRMAYFMILSVFLLRNIKFIQTCHTDPQYEARSSFERAYRTFLYRQGFMIPVVLTQDFKSKFGRYFDKINPYCVNNGRPYREKTVNFDQVKDEVLSYKKTADTKVLIHVARFGKEKNQRMLIKSILALIDKGQDVVLLVLGSGFDEIKSELLPIDKSSSIYFLGMKENVEDYLRCSDAFCLSSTFEGMPLSVIEAMSVGCVPIVTPVGALSEMLKNGALGFVSASTSQADYEKAILAFLKNNHVKKDDLMKCFQDNYSVETMANKYNYIYTMT